MFKLAAIIGGVLLMAGVAFAGTMTSLDSTNSPTVGTTPSPATFTVRHDDRGQVTERGRMNEPGEDLRGPCDEPEHANDARCTGAPAADDHRGDRNRGPGGRDDSSGPGSGDEDGSGHEDGHDD
ncbi:MAG TPA: hypothetical protein VHQ98_04590 [Gaiellaceae bacterium]|nr:hypothetical protein [Gaiellaceae bacterium]